MINSTDNAPINILLADDDADERFFFEAAVNDMHITNTLKTVNDGIYLMDFLKDHLDNLPDILFLDINMPRRNGKECLAEIRSNETLKHLPIIIYSNAGSDQDVSLYYQGGASDFVLKGDYPALAKCVNNAIAHMA